MFTLSGLEVLFYYASPLPASSSMSSEGLMDRLLALVGVGVDTLVEDVLLLLPPADLRAARQVRVEMLLFPSTSCTSSARSVRP